MKHKQYLKIVVVLVLFLALLFPVPTHAIACPGAGAFGTNPVAALCGGTTTAAGTCTLGTGTANGTPLPGNCGITTCDSAGINPAVCDSGTNDATCDGGSCGPYQEANGQSPCYSNNSGTNQNGIVACYVNPAISLLAGLVGLVVVISIILGGFQYMTSAGDPQKAAKARGRIINAIIALIGIGLLYGILQFILPGGYL